MEILVEYIQSLGFPIAMVIYFIYDKNKTTKEMFDTIEESNEKTSQQITETLKTITLAITENSRVLTKFIEHFDFDNNVGGGGSV